MTRSPIRDGFHVVEVQAHKLPGYVKNSQALSWSIFFNLMAPKSTTRPKLGLFFNALFLFF